MENEFQIQDLNANVDSETKAKIKKLMEYFALLRDNGTLDIFSQLFQTEYRILSYLQHHPGAHPSIMADALKVTRPNIAANLRLLEEKGYIERVIDQNNRRQVYVNMTESGLEYLSLIDNQLALLFVSWFKILGDEEIEHFFKILEVSSSPELITKELRNFSFGN